MKQLKISLVILSTLFLITCATFPKKSAPGMYLNGWPAFSVSYPAQWLEKTPVPPFVFIAEASGGFPSLRVAVLANMHTPLKYSTRVYIPELAKMGKDINVIYDEEASLKDDTPAREMEIEWVLNSGIRLNSMFITAKKEDVWITVSISDTKGKIEEDLKGIPYSLKIKPGKEEPVELPDDIQELFDQLSRDIVSHNLEKVMLHYSDQFLHNGICKADVEAFYKRVILGITSFQVNVTRFESQKNRAYMAGYTDVNQRKVPLPGMSLIKENGQWKFYGNQKQKEM